MNVEVVELHCLGPTESESPSIRHTHPEKEATP